MTSYSKFEDKIITVYDLEPVFCNIFNETKGFEEINMIKKYAIDNNMITQYDIVIGDVSSSSEARLMESIRDAVFSKIKYKAVANAIVNSVTESVGDLPHMNSLMWKVFGHRYGGIQCIVDWGRSTERNRASYGFEVTGNYYLYEVPSKLKRKISFSGCKIRLVIIDNPQHILMTIREGSKANNLKTKIRKNKKSKSKKQKK